MLMLATIFQSLLAFLFVVVGLLMIGIILLQKNRGAGLSGAFGGVGGHSAFGTKTGDFLTWITVGFTATLILLAVVANYAFTPTPTADALGISAPSPTIPTGLPQPTAPQPGAPGPATTIQIPPRPMPVTPQQVATPPIGGSQAPTGGASATPANGAASPTPAPAGSEPKKP